MLGRITKISEIYRSKAFRAVFLCLAFLLIITGAYGTLPNPYILDSSDSNSPHKVTFSAPFTLRFSQNMNKKSVEESFKIHPKIRGEFIWPDGRTLEYHPSSSLDIDDNYKIVIEKTASNIYKKSLKSDYTLYFTVTGSPFVKFVSPYFSKEDVLENQPDDEYDDETVPIVASDQIITVMFDRPMEWLGAGKKDLIIIDPPVKGEYRFLGMSAFQFIPDIWPTGSRFHLTIPAGISARNGGITEKEFKWKIETSPLHVTEVIPENNSTGIEINQFITVHFSQPVDLNQIKPGENILLYPSNDMDSDKNPKFDGFFNTEVTYGKDKNNNQDKNILVFKPTFPYLPETEYRFVINAGLVGPSSSDVILAMKEDFEFKFKTASSTGIAEFIPPNNENPSIFLRFYTSMTVEELKKGLIFYPELPNPPVIILNEKSNQAEIKCEFSDNEEYTFEFKKGILDANGNEIKTGFKQTFVSPKTQTSLKWVPDENLSLFMPRIDPEFSIRSKNINTLNLKLCEVSDQNFISVNEKQGWGTYRCNGLSKNIKLASDDIDATLINLTSLFDYKWKSGIYYFSAEGGGNKIHKIFFISDTSLVLKKSENSLIVWATDTITGGPISRMELIFYSYEGKELARGVTDGDGIYRVTRELGEGIYIIGKKNINNENRWVILHEYWSTPQKISNFAQWIRSNESRLYIISDKNKALAGERLNIKGIWRIDNDAQLTLPEDKNIKLILENEKHNVIFNEIINLRQDGSLDTVIELPLNISAGKYSFFAYNKNGELISSNSLSIQIEERPASFEIKWLNPQNDFVQNDIVLLNLGAQYDIGVPAANIKGEWKLYKKQYYVNQKSGNEFYSFGKTSEILCSKGACGSEQEWVNSGDFAFDQNGIAKIVSTDKEGNLKAGYEYRLLVHAKGISGTQTSEEFIFKVHQAKYHTGISAKHYILNQEDNIEGSFIALDAKNNLLEGKRIKISLTQMSNGKELKNWYEKTLITESGSTNFSITTTSKMPSGIYKLKAESQDGGGYAELEIYILSEEMNELTDDFAIFVNQNEFFVGGKARLLINYPSYEKAINALITYERGGILGYQIVELKTPLTSTEIPIIEEMTPNIHISATVIRRSDNINTFIKGQEKRRSEAEKIEAEVALILVEQELSMFLESENVNDEKIDGLKKQIELLKKIIESPTEKTNEINLNIQDIQPKIETASTEIIISNREREIYIDITPQPLNPNPGEEVTLKIRTYDYQNRPIKSVLALNVIKKEKNDLLYNPFDYFYRPRNSQIFSSSNVSLPKHSAIINQIPPFSDIADQSINAFYSAYFNPAIVTDSNGHAEIKFILPDQYAVWQANAVATNETKRFGSTAYDIFVEKNLLIHPVVPSFIIFGDAITVSAIMQNLSEKDIESRVEIFSDDIKIKGGAKKAILVPAGQTAKINWDIEINTFTEQDSIKLIFNSAEDNVEMTLPIKNLKALESSGGSGFLENKWIGNLRIAENAIPGTGGLFISLSSTPINIIEKCINIIKNHSYFSSENLASKLIAKSIIYQMGLDDMDAEKINDEIKILSSYILGYQKSDGGYSFWQNTESNPWLTAYVLYALKKADISNENQSTAIKFLWNNLNNVSISDRLFILWALSEIEQYDTRSTVSAFQLREEASLASRAFLLMNISNLINAGQKSAYPYLEKLKSEIVDQQIIDDKLIYFEEEMENYLDTNVRTTAIILLTLNKLGEDNPLLMPMVKYITSSVISNRLNSQESIWLAVALSEFIKNKEIADINYKAKVSVNNSILIKENFTQNDSKQIYQSFLPLNSIKSPSQINEIAIEKDGMGPLYFYADLNYFLSNDSILPLEENMLITRYYYDIEDYKEIHPLSELQAGSLYKGVLTLIIPKDFKYITLENPLPAGIKALSFNPALGDPSHYYQQQEIIELQGLNWINNPIWNFNSFEIEDDRLIIFAEDLPAGVYKIDYIIQANLPGRYNHMPATINQIFNSSIYARTNGEWLEIK